MKKFLFLLLVASGLLAWSPTDSKAATVVVVEPGHGYYHHRYHHVYYHHGYYYHRY